MAEDLGEKSEQPTTKRLTDARERGQVPKSQDLGGVIALLGIALILAFFGKGMLIDGYTLMRAVLAGNVPEALWATESMSATSRLVFVQTGIMLAPVLGLAFVAAYVGSFVQVGWLWTLKPLQPKFSNLNPINGVKKTFGKRGLVKTGTGLIKLVFVLPAALFILWRQSEEMAVLPMLEPVAIAARLAMMAVELSAWLVLLLLIAGLIDLIYQRYQHTEDLKMTKQEVKDERKSMEGDPQTKQRRMQVARDMAVQRINSAVPQADVVVTNPTHFAVALQYKGDEMRAPKVVAKGADFMAMRIRQVASSHGVAIVERPPLARALYAGVEVGDQVPPEQYEAVAEVLAYVYRLEGRAQTQKQEQQKREEAAAAG